MTIWRLVILVITTEREFSRCVHWFKTLKELMEFKDNYEMERRDKLGKYVSNFWKINYDYEVYDYEEIKDELTIAEYEQLFGTNVKANVKLSVDDFEEGMWVWNQTEGCYQ